MNVGMDDVVVLHLAAVEDRVTDADDGGAVPVDVTTAGISEVLGFDDRGMAGRVTLLSTLEDLRHDGAVEERQAPVAGRNGRRVAYTLTDKGRRRAESVREQVRDLRVTVRTEDGGTEEVPLSEIDRYVDDPALPRALARTTDDGVLYVETSDDRFVDRREELTALEAVLADTEERDEGVAVLVSGEAGVGKTTLVTEEFADTAAEAGFRVVVGNCRADASHPYAPFDDVLAEIDDESVQLVRDRSGGDIDDPGEYDAKRAALFERITDRIAAAAETTPLVLVVEDLHLAGSPTVALFEHLAAGLSASVAIVGTYRPEDLSPDHSLSDRLEDWPGHDEDGDRRRHLHLSPFDLPETRQLIETAADRPTVSREFAELIHERTGGNPLFVEETVRQALEEGIADPADDDQPTDQDALPLPDSVEEAVDLRLSDLDDATREVLRVAALLGQTVPRDVIAEAVDLPATDLRTHLDLLVEARVLERVDDETLRFVSGLVRETCVERIPEETRGTLHERIAAAYEAVTADDPDRQAAVAYHRREAGDWQAALEAYREAGDHALDVYAAESAREAYESALAVARSESDIVDDEDVLDVLESLADAEYLLDEYDDADRRLQYVAEHTTDADRRRSVARRRARMWRERGDYDRALRIVQEARDEVGIADTRASALLESMEGFVHGKRGEFDAAEERYDRAVEILDRLDDEDLPEEETVDDLRRSFEHDRAGLDLERGAVDEETIETYETELDRARESDDEQNLAISLLNLGLAYGEYGEFEAAEKRLRESIEHFEAVGVENMVCDARNTLGSMLWQAGRPEDAIEEFETALETARDVGNERIVAYTNGNVGEIRFARGDLERAAERTERAMEAAESIGNPHYWTLFAVSRARQAIARDRPDTAAEFATDALDYAREADLDDEARMALGLLGDVARVRGDLERALDRYERGLEELDDDADHEPTDGSSVLYRGLARTRVDADDPEAGVDPAETAVSIAEGTIHDDELIRGLTTLAAAHREAGDLDAADEALDRAEAVAEETGWSFLGWRAGYERALLARAEGDEEAASERLERVRDRASEGGADRLTRRCREALDAAH